MMKKIIKVFCLKFLLSTEIINPITNNFVSLLINCQGSQLLNLEVSSSLQLKGNIQYFAICIYNISLK